MKKAMNKADTMGYVFISYSREDKPYVDKLKEALDARGMEYWVDDRIDYGTKWPRVIEEKVDGCAAFILIMSDNSKSSVWVPAELARAIEKKKPIFPLLLQGERWLEVQATQCENVGGERLPTERYFTSVRNHIQLIFNKVLPSIWDVHIEQGGKTADEVGNTVSLKRSPFSFVLTMPMPGVVKVNASTDGNNFLLINPGRSTVYNQADGIIHCFINGLEMAEREFNQGETLFINPRNHHYWYYKNDLDHRWSKAANINNRMRFEWVVSKIMTIDNLARYGPYEIKDIPYSELYILFLVKQHEDTKIHDDELKKMVLKF